MTAMHAVLLFIACGGLLLVAVMVLSASMLSSKISQSADSIEFPDADGDWLGG